MLIFDNREIGNRLLTIRKRSGLTQAELAEAAGLADRTYADIERGYANMRVETLLRICRALHITPDEVLTVPDAPLTQRRDALLERLTACTAKDQATALRLLEVFFQSLS